MNNEISNPNNEGINSVAVIMLPDGRMDAVNAAAYLGLKPKTLALMRCDGTGPKFVKLGRVFYFKDDLDAWINNAQRCQSTAQARFHGADKIRGC
jgi:hypothetical protein